MMIISGKRDKRRVFGAVGFQESGNSLPQNTKMHDIPVVTGSFIPENGFDPNADLHISFIFIFDVGGQDRTSPIRLDKTISIGRCSDLPGFGIHKWKSDDGIGSNRSLGTDLNRLCHYLKAATAYLPGGGINFLATGTTNSDDFLAIPQFSQKLAFVISGGIGNPSGV